MLWHLLNQSGQFNTWADMEQIIQTFVGWTDSLTFGQLGGLLAGAGIRTLADVPDLATLQKMQTDIVRGELGVQNIRSDWFEQPLGGPEQATLAADVHRLWPEIRAGQLGVFADGLQQHPLGGERRDEQGATPRARAPWMWRSRSWATTRSCPSWSRK